MNSITATSRVTLLFTITWHSVGVGHREQFYAEKVSLWRDIFPPGMHDTLLGKSVGDRVSMVLQAEDFHAPYSEKLLRTITPVQFSPPQQINDRTISPVVGRYYPQNFLTGVPGVFRVSTTPCRLVDKVGDLLVFDLNHPLAGYQLLVAAEILSVDSGGKQQGGRCEDWLERISADGPGMQRVLAGKGAAYNASDNMIRVDDQPDTKFYASPRRVQHLDSTALRLITEQYGRLLAPGGVVLDLMASWDSHLPAELPVDSLTVLGLNREELEENKAADTVVVHDLNQSAHLPYADEVFAAVICTASIEYLIDPVSVCREASRVLKKGGVLAISFSNRWFPTKAIAVWQEMHEFERLGFVVEILLASDCYTDLATHSIRGFPRPSGDSHYQLPCSDPVYIVSARKR